MADSQDSFCTSACQSDDGAAVVVTIAGHDYRLDYEAANGLMIELGAALNDCRWAQSCGTPTSKGWNPTSKDISKLFGELEIPFPAQEASSAS